MDGLAEAAAKMFQSLSGFWWGFCMFLSVIYSFSLVALVSIPFRVLVGFLHGSVRNGADSG